MGTEEFDELFVDDFDNLLGRIKGGEHFLAEGLFFNGFNELFDDFEMDVGFEEGDADFAERRVHILRGEFALAAEIFEDLLQFIAEILEHIFLLYSSASPLKFLLKYD